MAASTLRLVTAAACFATPRAFCPSVVGALPHVDAQRSSSVGVRGLRAVAAPETEPSVAETPARVSPKDWFDSIRKQAGHRERLVELIKAGDELLAASQLPHRKMEPYRYTDLESLYRTPYAPASAATADGLAQLAPLVAMYKADGAAGRQIIFLDGVFSADLSDLSAVGDGVTVAALSTLEGEALEQAAGLLSFVPEVGADYRTCQGALPFASLSQACFRDAALVSVAAGAQIEEPIQVLFLSTGGDAAAGAPATFSHPRLAVAVGAGAKATLLQSYGGAGEYFANCVTRVVLAEGAELLHFYLQEQTASAQHIETVAVDVAGNATYRSRAVGIGARHGRLNLQVELREEGAHTQMDGVNLCSGRQFLDTHSSIRHAAPDTTSGQEQRNILAHRSECVFKGRIRVESVAQGTDSKQLCKTLLLSDTARITAMPSLEIIADDVKCAHGATVSDLDEESLFYLQSRGLDKMRAKSLVVNAFAYNELRDLPCPRLAARAQQKLVDMTPTFDRAVKGEFSSI